MSFKSKLMTLWQNLMPERNRFALNLVRLLQASNIWETNLHNSCFMCIYALVVFRVYICWLVLLKSYNSGCFIRFTAVHTSFCEVGRELHYYWLRFLVFFRSFFTISFVFFSGAHVVCDLCSESVHQMSSCFSSSSASLSVLPRDMTVRKAFVQGWKNTEC